MAVYHQNERSLILNGGDVYSVVVKRLFVKFYIRLISKLIDLYKSPQVKINILAVDNQ